MRIHKISPKESSACVWSLPLASAWVFSPTTLFLKTPVFRPLRKNYSGPKYAAITSPFTTLLHTLEKKGIRKPEATLGTALSDPAKTTSLCQEYEKELKSFAYSRLSEENRLTCDMLLLYFHTRASLGKNQRPG